MLAVSLAFLADYIYPIVRTVPCDTGSPREELEKDPEFEGRELLTIYKFANARTQTNMLFSFENTSRFLAFGTFTIWLPLLSLNMQSPSWSRAPLFIHSQTDDWTSKKGKYAANITALQARARYVRNFLRSRPEKCIVLVAHGDILRYIVFGEQNATPWSNAEVRKYTFVEEEDEDAWLKLIETEAKEGHEEPTSSSKTTNGQLWDFAT